MEGMKGYTATKINEHHNADNCTPKSQESFMNITGQVDMKIVMKFISISLVCIGLVSHVVAICPGFNFGVADLGFDPGTGKEGYAVLDDSCNQVAGAITSNVCDEPLFSCSPPPIKITQLHLNGLNYACRGDPNAGACNGAPIQVCCRNDGH